jgi:exonuclease SbcC
MIESLLLSNFQSHEETRLDFVPGVNVIIGSSNSGKSALMRGLFWVLNNRPSGTAFVSHWNQDKKGEPVDNTEVMVTTKEGGEVLRIRAKGANAYLIDGKTAEAIRTDVPPEVIEVLNMNDINVQRQMDGPFLLSESSAEVARFFNRIIHLDVIDTVLAEAERQRRALGQSVQAKTLEAEKHLEKAESLSWVDEAQALFGKAENVNDRITETRAQAEVLQASVEDYGRQTKVVAQATKLISLDLPIRAIENLNSSIEANALQRQTLSELIGTHQRHLETVNRAEKLLAIEALVTKANTLYEANGEAKDRMSILQESIRTYRSQETAIEAVSRLLSLGGSVDTLLERKAKREDLSGLLVEYSDLEAKTKKAKKEIEELTAQLPDLCPTCGKSMKGDTHAQEHLPRL